MIEIYLKLLKKSTKNRRRNKETKKERKVAFYKLMDTAMHSGIGHMNLFAKKLKNYLVLAPWEK